MKLNQYPAYQLLKLLDENKVNILDIYADFSEAIENQEPSIKAWEHLNQEYVQQQAQQLEDKRKQQQLGRLGGIPIGIKDVFNTIDFPTEMGSQIWKGFTPGNDSRVVHYLRKEGAVVMGKTVTAEFAVHHLADYKTKNPHNPKHIPGTSSSGSAAAVATKMVPLSLGTQTGGSIIRPASFCGTYGLKPSFGLVPRTGVLKTTDTLDTIGGFSNHIEDLKILLDCIRVKGIDFPIAQNTLNPDFQLDKNRKIKIGFIIDNFWLFDAFPDYAIQAFDEYISDLSNNSRIELHQLILDDVFASIHDYHRIIYDKTLSYYFKNEFDNTNYLLSSMILDSIQKGKKITPEQYKDALNQQVKIRQYAQDYLKEFDIVLCLSTAGEAPLIGDKEHPDFCLLWTFLGVPTLNIPMFKSPKGLPFGLQVVANRYQDYQLIEYAKLLL